MTLILCFWQWKIYNNSYLIFLFYNYAIDKLQEQLHGKEQIQQEYDESKKDFVNYCKNRTPWQYGFDNAEEMLRDAQADGDRENTIREQAYLKGLEKALEILQ